ncbi:MAG: threonine synthase [Bacillota bacterium]|nr:threonine synthase [Bacillota bacterium]
MWRGVWAEWGRFLPRTEKTPELTLYEGGTPLLPAPRLAEWVGGGVRLYLKFEGQNPTGSFKDRGMVVAVAKALEAGARHLVCASTGNTSASAAAYAAAAGIRASVLIPAGKIARGKLAQAARYGARILAVRGNFDQALAVARQLAESRPELALVNSVNPMRLEGQKTAAFEVVEQLGEAPDVLALPVGNAGNITAYWMGFLEYRRAGLSRKLPRLFGFQAEGAAPLVLGHPVERPETVATAIRIGRPASGEKALAAARDSGGAILAVSDAEILEAYAAVARLSGLFAEPASAAPVAGLRRLAAEGRLEAGQRVVAVLTGNGLKDPETALGGDLVERSVESVEAEPRAVAERLLAGSGVA